MNSSLEPLFRGVSVSNSLRHFCRSFSVFLLLTGVLVAQSPRQPLITRPINESVLVTLKGNTHPLAQPRYDMGIAPPDLPMNRMLLVLNRDPQQDFALRKLLDDQQDKNSPNFHRWMTPAQFGAQFGATDQDIQLVTGWLQTHGFQIDRVSNGRSVIEFSGVESQVEQAFHTQVHRYVLPNGEQHWANASDPQIPAALAPAVAGVWTLNNFRKRPRIRISKNQIPIPAKGASPLLTFNGRHALMPGDFATIYNLNPLYSAGVNGQGTTIAVVARSDFNQGDLSSFRSLAGLPSPALKFTLDGPDPGIFDPSEEFEADLDATWSGAIAPNATINFVVSASTNTTDGVDLSELYIVDNNAGDVMTESFGSCEGLATQAEAQALSALAEQAAAEGITYMVSAGDSGAEGCVSPSSNSAAGAQASVNVLASPPYVVAVGGTMFNEGNNSSTYWNSTNNQTNLSSAKSYIPEKVWNESCINNCGLWAGGGGASTFFSKPNWQFGVSGIPGDGARDLPDVSLTAAGGHDPYLLCFEGSCNQGGLYGVGGTSASAPSFAGIMALVVQQYGRQGVANYTLYRLAASETLSQCNASNGTPLPASTCVFNDVTLGNNAVPGESGYGTTSALYQSGTGYDLASGLGSVDANNLLGKWSTVTFNATTTTLGPSTISGTHGSPVTLNIAVAPSSGSGTPTGDVSLQTSLVGINSNPGFITLSSGAFSAAVNNLPGGSYTLTARYAGDSIYAPSTSSGVSVSISPENSTTSLALFDVDQTGHLLPLTTAPYGSFIYFQSAVAGSSGQGTPTGAISFQDNGTFNLGTLAVNSTGVATTPAGYFGFSVGQHSVSATYGGDSSFQTSAASPVSFSVTPAVTTTSIQASSNSAVQGARVDLTATVMSPAFRGFTTFPLNGESLVSPSGSVTFVSGTTQLGTVQSLGTTGTTGSGTVTTFSFATASLPTGPNSITAQYSGDTNYAGSTSTAITVNVSADFAFAIANNSVAVSQGGSATNTLTITGLTGYSNTVNFSSTSCTGLPVLTTCSFNPASVTGTGSSTVTIRTTAPSSAAAHSFGVTAVGLLFSGVLLMAFPSRRFRCYAATSVIFCFFAFGMVACGGGSASTGAQGGPVNPGTPKGSYTVTVTAITSDHVISHSASFTLVVQ